MAKDEFVKINLKLIATHAVIGSDQPLLQIPNGAVSQRQYGVGAFAHMRKRKRPYFTALREAMPELINITTGKESRPAQLEEFTRAFSFAGEKREKACGREDTDAPEALFRQS